MLEVVVATRVEVDVEVDVARSTDEEEGKMELVLDAEVLVNELPMDCGMVGLVALVDILVVLVIIV